MISLRDILIFAGLAALAAAVIASLFPMGEGASPVPACSDCAFKLTGGYWVLQHRDYASLYLGTREVARYGWAYVDGEPLRIGENITCNPMYVYVLDGMAYISCRDVNPVFGKKVLPTNVEDSTNDENVRISVNWGWYYSYTGCRYIIDVVDDRSDEVRLELYTEKGKLVYSDSRKPPARFTLTVTLAGTYYLHVYAPPVLDEWYTLYAGVEITGTKIAIFKNENFESLKQKNLRPAVTLKISDNTDYWRNVYSDGYQSVVFADYYLYWDDCSTCNSPGYEYWRLYFSAFGILFEPRAASNYYSSNWHEVYADGQLIWTYGKENDVRTYQYKGSFHTITVAFASRDSTANATATFTKVCRWWSWD